MPPMRILPIPVILLIGLIAGCTGQSAVKPVEVLDDRSAVTVGALKEPIELVPNSQNTALVSRKRTSFAYLGPVEWDRSGAISYNLWVQKKEFLTNALSMSTQQLTDNAIDPGMLSNEVERLERELSEKSELFGQSFENKKITLFNTLNVEIDEVTYMKYTERDSRLFQILLHHFD